MYTQNRSILRYKNITPHLHSFRIYSTSEADVKDVGQTGADVIIDEDSYS